MTPVAVFYMRVADAGAGRSPRCRRDDGIVAVSSRRPEWLRADSAPRPWCLVCGSGLVLSRRFQGIVTWPSRSRLLLFILSSHTVLSFQASRETARDRLASTFPRAGDLRPSPSQYRRYTSPTPVLLRPSASSRYGLHAFLDQEIQLRPPGPSARRSGSTSSQPRSRRRRLVRPLRFALRRHGLVLSRHPPTGTSSSACSSSRSSSLRQRLASYFFGLDAGLQFGTSSRSLCADQSRPASSSPGAAPSDLRRRSPRAPACVLPFVGLVELTSTRERAPVGLSRTGVELVRPPPPMSSPFRFTGAPVRLIYQDRRGGFTLRSPTVGSDEEGQDQVQDEPITSRSPTNQSHAPNLRDVS